MRKFAENLYFPHAAFYMRLLALTLFMALVLRTNYHNFAVSFNYLALVAHRFYGRSYFHNSTPQNFV